MAGWSVQSSVVHWTFFTELLLHLVALAHVPYLFCEAERFRFGVEVAVVPFVKRIFHAPGGIIKY